MYVWQFNLERMEDLTTEECSRLIDNDPIKSINEGH